MTDRVFLDTNVLVYAVDDARPAKRDRARSVRDDAIRRGAAVISPQVLHEFYVTTTRKLARPLSPEDAEAIVQKLAPLAAVAIDADLVLAAVRTSREHRLSYWDALILRSALVAGCDRVLSEDLQDGFQLESVRVENPFAGL